MKNLFIFILCFIFVSSSFGLVAAKRKTPQTQILKGSYIPYDPVTKAKVKDLPIPNNGQDYAIYQSINDITNVIIGDFKSGKNTITLISDTHSDGEVDCVFYWYADTKKYKDEPNPKSIISKEKFLKYKKHIFRGIITDLSPNREGTAFIKKMVLDRATKPVNISKKHLGYVLHMKDIDEPSHNRLTFSFSNNGINGTDLSFAVFFRNIGLCMLKIFE